VRRSSVAVFVGVTVAGLAAGCSFTPPGGGGGGGGGDDDDVETFVDDTEQDFADPRALVGAALHRRGAIDPETYAVGGLHMTAYRQAILQAGNTVTWAQLETMVQGTTPTGTRQAAQVEDNYGNSQPFGLGLNTIDNFTLVYRGEVYLEGTTAFTLDSDGPAVVEIDTDGTFGNQLYDQADTPTGTKMVVPPAPGWYPIRAALTDTVGPAFIRLRTTNGPIPPARLRSRTTAAPGLVLEGFEDPLLLTPVGLGLEVRDLQHDFAGLLEPTWDLALLSPNTYGVRMRGQWLVETPGRYRLGAAMVDADDQVRIWLDGKMISSKWGPGDMYDESMPLELAAGWHDLAIDFAGNGQSAFAIHVLDAPLGAPTGVIPGQQLRPVVRFGQLDSFTSGAVPVINDNTSTDIPLPAASLAVPAGSVVQAVDIGFDLTHSAPGQVTVKLVHPDGTADAVRANDPTERMFELYGARTAFDGKSLAPGAVWKLVVEDNAAGFIGNISRITAVIGYRGGPPPVTQTALFESKPRPLPAEATEIVAVRTVPAAPAGATIAISIRTCETEDACAAAAWQPVTDEELAIPAAPFVEYKLELGSDGWALPTVERVEIDYRVR
jgi:subtilisin-like proprotein convertase family protein